MIAKEWRDARWKLAVATVGVVPALLIVAAYLPPYKTAWRVVERFGDRTALEQILNVYEGGAIALAFLAVLLGAAAVSEEVRRGTIFLLLSRPVNRSRLLLTKYAISAGALLSAAVAGHVALILAAIARGYPPGLWSVRGVVLSTVLLWIWSLSVLGLAFLFSVAFGNTPVSLMITAVVTYLSVYALPHLLGVLVRYGTTEGMTPLYWWTNATLYAGEGLAPFNFLVCIAVAASLLLAPLWLFRRKAY